ncbi:MAG: hypothetical protein E7417_00370 [Ruminococcaceae bacterium]|nr:hypothetical protein [Oscillospiraceae bacterium]
MKTNFKKMLSLALSAIMVAAILPMSAMAAGETKAVKEDIDWENWTLTNEPWSTLMDGTAINVVNKDGGVQWWCSNAYSDGKMRLTINDAGSTATEDGNYVIDSNSAATSSDGKAWGFMGTKYYTGWLGAEGARLSTFPADRWLGVKDISAHKDTGYAVFTIESVTGDADNAYLAIKGAPMDWDIEELVHRMLGNAQVTPEDTNAFPITPERYPATRSADQPFKDFYNTKVVGVRLTDYYDVAKGGRQTVAIPLSKLVNSPDFNEAAGNADAAGLETRRNMAFDLRLFGGMGVARKDSGKQKDFTVIFSDLAIVDPAVPQELYIEQDNEYVVVTFEKTADTDVDFKVKRTSNGVVEYFDAPEGVLEDVIDPTKTYMYQAVAVDKTYGVEAATEAVFVGSEGVDILKAEMNWKDYVGEGGDAWHNYLEGERYFIGDLSIYNNSMMQGYDLCAGGNMVAKLDDSNAGTEYKISSQMYNADGVLADVPTVGGLWGYKGMSYNNLKSYTDMTKVPDDVWFGIKDIKEWEKSGYAVFTINSVSGDADNAYLAITTLTDQWQLPTWAWDAQLPITKAAFADKDWNFDHGMILVAGAKLTDYYDVEKGGSQTVAVPLDKLVNNPDFEELKSQSSQQIIDKKSRDDFEYTKAELYLFTGMGIAKRDGAAGKNFQAQVSEMKIVALQDPTNLVATKNSNGSISFTFDTTSDVGVSFKIAKTVDGVTTYLDAPGGACTDSDIDPKKTYTYKAVAYNSEYDIYSAGSEPFVKEAELVSVVRADMDWKNWVDQDQLWFNYLEDETYFYGNVGVYNDYAGGHTYFAGGDMPVGIDDSGAATTKSIATKMYVVNDGNGGDLMDIPNIGGFWGYSGLSYNKMRSMADKSNVPSDVWFGVKSIKSVQDSGYAVFTIDGVTGDADNAYLAITTLPDPSQIPAFALDKDITLPITKEGNEDKSWGGNDEHYVSVVTGVKLTDYYDVATGGEQTVKIPLSEFVEDPEFMEFRSKVVDGITSRIDNEEYMANFVPELHLFTGMGIAKRDSGENKTFAATIKAAKVVGVDAPANLEAAVNEDGSVTVTFDTTMDKDAIFKVKRVCGNETVYFDAQEGTYTDTTREASKTYTYYAVTQNEEYGLEAVSESVVIESESTNYAKLYKGEGESKVETGYVSAGTMSAAFFTTDKAATGYIARYDAEGILLGANLVQVPVNEEKTVSLAGVEATDTVKVMFWADAEPVVDAIVAGEKPLMVLYIGDNDVLEGAEYVDEIAVADGIDVEVRTIATSGATVASYAENFADIKGVVAGDEWDYILIQESINAVMAGTGYVGLADLVSAIEENSTGVIEVVDGWSYSEEKAEGSVDDMYSVLEDTAKHAFTKVCKTADAIYCLYNEGINTWADNGYDLNDAGKLAVGLQIYESISGAVATENTFTPDGVDNAEIIREFVAGC